MRHMERKGLSQILYLIIAASVLMMVAMVITFTATDTIGNLGGTAEESACGDSIQGQCTATSATAVSVPTTCVTQDQYVEPYLSQSTVNTEADGSGNDVTPSDLVSGTQGYVDCSLVR